MCAVAGSSEDRQGYHMAIWSLELKGQRFATYRSQVPARWIWLSVWSSTQPFRTYAPTPQSTVGLGHVLLCRIMRTIHDQCLTWCRRFAGEVVRDTSSRMIVWREARTVWCGMGDDLIGDMTCWGQFSNHGSRMHPLSPETRQPTHKALRAQCTGTLSAKPVQPTRFHCIGSMTLFSLVPHLSSCCYWRKFAICADRLPRRFRNLSMIVVSTASSGSEPKLTAARRWDCCG